MPTGGGGGGGGLSSVTTNATLTGAGTSGSPLGITGIPLTFFTWSWPQSATVAAGPNQVNLTGFYLPAQFTLNNLGINISVADGVNNSDIGIYSAAGTLLAHIGGTHMAATGFQRFAVIGAPVTINPGMLVFAWASAATTLSILYSVNQPSWVQVSNGGTAVSGVLPNSITAPTFGVSATAFNFQLS